MKTSNNRCTTANSCASAAKVGADATSFFPPPPKMSTRSKSGSGYSTTNRKHATGNNEDEARDPRDVRRGGKQVLSPSLSLPVSAREEGPETSLREECDGGTSVECSTEPPQKERNRHDSMKSKSSNKPSSVHPTAAKKKIRNKVAAVNTETGLRNTEGMGEKKSKESSSSSSNGVTQSDDRNPPSSSPLASSESFDHEAMLQVVPSNYSFGGLSALKIDGGSGSGSYHGGGGGDAIDTTTPTHTAIDDLNLIDVDDDNINPSSWDLLNQADSFGFNLLGSHGSLSFENDGDEGCDANNDRSKVEDGGGNEKPIGELNSTVTASMDDQYCKTQTKRAAYREGGVMDTAIVNNSIHSWIPPNCSPPPPHQQHQRHQHHHYPHQLHDRHGQEYNPHFPHPSHGVVVHQQSAYQSNHPYYNAPHQYPHLPESRSDVPHNSSYNFMEEEIRDDTISNRDVGGVYSNNGNKHQKNISNADSIINFDNDPFKYAFGDPSSSGGKVDRSRRSHSGKAPTASYQSKKRKQEDRSHGSTGAPFHHHRAPVPTSSSNPKVPKGKSGQLRDDNPIKGRVDGNERPRSEKISRSQPQGSMMHFPNNIQTQSMAWHDSSNTNNGTIHDDFLPPLPSKDPANRQKHSSSSIPPIVKSMAHHDRRSASVDIASASNPPPCKEVYITTRTSTSLGTSVAPVPIGRRGAYQPPIVAPQYTHHHHNSQYNYPPHGNVAPHMSLHRPVDLSNSLPNQGPRSTLPPPHFPPPLAAPVMPHPQQQRKKPTKGVALLALRNGKQLSRSQAPGIGWPPEEDMRLTEIMSNHKSSHVDWEALSKEPGLAGRTARECHDRWTRYLKPGSRKGQWTEEEDAIVLRVIFSNGGLGGAAGATTTVGLEKETGGLSSSSSFTQWADLAPQLPGRTGKQIRDRWVNYLNPAINHLPFSREDDLLLWHGHKEHGKRWVEISVKVFHSTRSENHIKNRWYSAAFKKFIAKEIGIDAYVESKQYERVGRKDDDTNMS